MKIDLSNIKNIIFDLGNVLLNLDFNASITAFQELGLDKAVLDNQNAYADPAFYNLETGKITPEEFCDQIRVVLNNPEATNEQIEDAWYAMIKDIPNKRVNKLLELNRSFNIYLYSNTNQIHIDKLLPDFKAEHGLEFSSLFKTAYYSHEIHDRKPEVSSFEKVIKLSKVSPEETLFVDDLEKNIRSAEQAGLKTLWLKEDMEMADLF